MSEGATQPTAETGAAKRVVHPRPPTPEGEPPKKEASNLALRLLTASLLIPSITWVIWQGGLFVLATVIVISLIALNEFYQRTKDEDATWPYKMDRQLSYIENRLVCGIKLANWRIFEAAAKDPRCKVCNAPFAGIGGKLVKPLGFGPSRKNPRLCKACIDTGPMRGTETDAGILFLKSGRVAVCVLTAENKDRSWKEENAGNVLCAKVAKEVANFFQNAPAERAEK